MPQQNKVLRDYRKLNRLLEEGSVFTAFDTETTGLHPESCRILEIGAVRFDKNGIIDTYNTLINPECVIPPEITRINHIDLSMVSSCRTVISVLPEFLLFIDKSVLVAHNANFDVDFVNAELTRCCMKPLKNRIIDTLEVSRWAYPTLSKHNLQFLAQAMKIEVKDAHRASDDARVCMEVFLRCIADTISVQK